MQLLKPTGASALCFMTGLSYLQSIIRLPSPVTLLASPLNQKLRDWTFAGETCYNAGTDVPMCASTGASGRDINKKDGNCFSFEFHTGMRASWRRSQTKPRKT
jgi:hypothetical protein